MDIRLLGPLEVACDERQVELPSGQPRALLTLLALSPGESLGTDRIIDALWRDAPPPSAAGVVQTYISRLRKLLGESSIRTIGGGYALELNNGTRDVDDVVRLRARARNETPEEAIASLLEALALFRGRPLADVAERDFAQAELRRLEELRMAIIAERLDVELALGRQLEMLPELESLVAAEPLDEAMRARLMLALYRCGRQAEALNVYGAGRAELAELGLEPGEALRRLQRAILEHDPSLAAPAKHEPATVESTPRSSIRPTKLRRRARRIAALGALLIVAAAGATAFAVRGGDAPPLIVPANSVAVIDPKVDRVVAAIPVGTRPVSVTAGAGAVWVTNEEDRTVSRIDPASLAVSGSIGLGFEPTDIEAVGDHVWVVGGFDHTLWRIDADGIVRRKLQFDERFGPLPVGYEKGPARLADDGHNLWLAHGNEVTRIDPVTGEQRGTVEAGGSWNAAIGVGKRGYVFDRSEGNLASDYRQSVQLFDPTRMARTGRIKTATAVSDIIVADGSAWLALFSDDAVWQVDDERGILEKTIPVDNLPVGLAFRDNALWVVSYGQGAVLRVNPSTGKVENVIKVGHTPLGIAVSNDLLFVAVRV